MRVRSGSGRVPDLVLDLRTASPCLDQGPPSLEAP